MTTTLSPQRTDLDTQTVLRLSRKALRKTPDRATDVIMRLPGEQLLQAAEDLGWQFVAIAPLNYASARNVYTVRKARAEVVLDTAK